MVHLFCFFGEFVITAVNLLLPREIIFHHHEFVFSMVNLVLLLRVICFCSDKFVIALRNLLLQR